MTTRDGFNCYLSLAGVRESPWVFGCILMKTRRRHFVPDDEVMGKEQREEGKERRVPRFEQESLSDDNWWWRVGAAEKVLKTDHHLIESPEETRQKEAGYRSTRFGRRVYLCIMQQKKNSVSGFKYKIRK